MRIILSLAVVSAGFSSAALGQTERDLESHLHGAASLNVAVVDSGVILELNTPWNNLVGFEHAPTTDEQRASVDNALALLNNPNQLMEFSGGDCKPDEIMVENSMAARESMEHDDHAEDQEHSDHSEDKQHSERSEDDGHDENKDAHGEEHEHEEEGHSTVLVSYSYQCGDIDKLKSIEMTLFSHWPGVEDLDVQLVGKTGQTLVELNPNSRSIDIAAVN